VLLEIGLAIFAKHLSIFIIEFHRLLVYAWLEQAQ
jgi:hypothetical protein